MFRSRDLNFPHKDEAHKGQNYNKRQCQNLKEYAWDKQYFTNFNECTKLLNIDHVFNERLEQNIYDYQQNYWPIQDDQEFQSFNSDYNKKFNQFNQNRLQSNQASTNYINKPLSLYYNNLKIKHHINSGAYQNTKQIMIPSRENYEKQYFESTYNASDNKNLSNWKKYSGQRKMQVCVDFIEQSDEMNLRNGLKDNYGAFSQADKFKLGGLASGVQVPHASHTPSPQKQQDFGSTRYFLDVPENNGILQKAHNFSPFKQAQTVPNSRKGSDDIDQQSCSTAAESMKFSMQYSSPASYQEQNIYNRFYEEGLQCNVHNESLYQSPNPKTNDPTSLSQTGNKQSKKSKGSSNQSKASTEKRCEQYLELATVKKPKRHFNNEQEKEKFVRQYQMKFKTEMCKNWELTGQCFFKDTCSFAHGPHELMKKKHLPSNYKTKACLQFHKTGYCPYGSRCQFLHSQFDLFDQDRLDYQNILSDNIRLSADRLNQLKDEANLDELIYINVFNALPGTTVCPSSKGTKRLKVFQQITGKHQPNATTANFYQQRNNHNSHMRHQNESHYYNNYYYYE